MKDKDWELIKAYSDFKNKHLKEYSKREKLYIPKHTPSKKPEIFNPYEAYTEKQVYNLFKKHER
jgi:hypothetical protein